MGKIQAKNDPSLLSRWYNLHVLSIWKGVRRIRLLFYITDELILWCQARECVQTAYNPCVFIKLSYLIHLFN